MNFRKALALLCAAVLSASLMGGCAGSKNEDQGVTEGPPAATSTVSSMQAKEAKPMVRIGALQGPTGLGLVELMEKNEQKNAGNVYEFTLAGAPDEISGKLINGELDIACVPTNLAAALYSKTEGKVKLAAVNTLGVLYVLQKADADDVESFADLAGKTIHSTGQAATQEYVLNYLLEENDAADAEVVFNAEHAELASLMVAGQVDYALLPQPFVTTVTGKDETVKVALDVTAEWNRATGGKELTMGCVIVRNEFLEKNQAAVDRFLEELDESVDYVNASVDEAAALSGKFGVVAEDVAKKAIPDCNIVCLTGPEMKTSVAAYLDVLFEADAKSVGGSLPDDAFYYIP